MNDFKGDTPRMVDAVAPKEIDRDDVLAELVHRFEEEDPSHAIAWVLDTLTELDILSFRERTDDPAKDLLGTVRRSRRGTVAVRDREDGAWPWHAVYGRDDDENDALCHENVTGWEKLAPMAGTPAAEAEKQEKAAQVADLRERIRREEAKLNACKVDETATEHPEVSGAGVPVPPSDPLSLPDRQHVAELLVRGEWLAAIRETYHRSGRKLSLADTKKYVEAMPEYLTGRNHRKVEDAPLPAEPGVVSP